MSKHKGTSSSIHNTIAALCNGVIHGTFSLVFCLPYYDIQCIDIHLFYWWIRIQCAGVNAAGYLVIVLHNISYHACQCFMQA